MNRACTVSRNRLFWGFILGLDLKKKKKKASSSLMSNSIKNIKRGWDLTKHDDDGY
jgi:hypothetical protein